MRICSDEQRKSIGLEHKIQLEEITQKVQEKKGRLQRYQDRAKQHRQNSTFQNNESKINQQVGEEWAKTYQQPDLRVAK